MFTIIKKWVKWLEKKLEGTPVTKYLSGKGKIIKKGG